MSNFMMSCQGVTHHDSGIMIPMSG